MNDCQIDSCDHCLVRLNSEAVSVEIGLSVAAVVVVVVVVAPGSETETDNAEMVVRMASGLSSFEFALARFNVAKEIIKGKRAKVEINAGILNLFICIQARWVMIYFS